MHDAVVIGGGITGLATAYFLHKKGQDVLLVEKESRVGGWIRSEKKEGFLIEYGPRTLRPVPLTLSLIEELGLTDQIVWASPNLHKRYIYLEKGLIRITPWLFIKHSLPLLKELFLKPIDRPEESIASFSLRHFGPWITNNIMDPLTLGIYGGNIDVLSLDRAFPLLKKLEREKGSILRGMRLPKKATLFSFKEGMQTLTDRLAEVLEGRIKLNCLEPPEARRVISTAKTDGAYLSMAVVTLGYNKRHEKFPGFGFLVPSHLGLALKGCLFQEEGRLFSFMMKPMALEAARDVALRASQEILGIQESPVLIDYFLAKEAIPQYTLGLDAVPPVGVNACISRALSYAEN